MDDREPLKQGNFLKDIKGKLCADKGYIIDQTLLEKTVLEWNTITDESEEQHEILVDECRGQNSVTKTGVD